MNKRLYVGGLSYSVDDDDLRALFEPCGEIKYVKVIREFDNGRSKGFGFVEMSTPEEARGAIERLHGTVHERRTITVSEAKPHDSSAGGSRGGGGGSRVGGGGRGRRHSGGGGEHRHREREEQY